jgi:hypothetical protein
VLPFSDITHATLSSQGGIIMDYQIKPVAIEGFADADGVVENAHGAWLGECDGEQVMPFADEDGDYIPAPANWRELIVREL